MQLEVVRNAPKALKYRHDYSLLAPPSGEQKRPN